MQNKLVTWASIAALAYLIPTAVAHAEPQAPNSAPATTGKAPVTIVLVHGAWADGSSWDRVVPMLEAKGFNVVSVHLPLTSSADDVAATTRAIDRQAGDVVLVGHSYGGFVISEAGNDPKVKSLVYVCAFGLDDGESINGLSKNNPPAWVKALQVDSGGFAWLPPEEISKDFAQDVPASDQKLITAKQGPIPVKYFDEVMKNPAWKSKPSWYVRGTADHMIDPAAQASMAKRMKATTTSINSGHVAMLSKPRQVANVILDAAGAPAATARK
ncbi:MAG: alpha/beta hydrolase [Myxococcales bacterium]|nr:alpha/beta hydrolase [Myxococcales bacterium]